jgi:hypothetical protein
VSGHRNRFAFFVTLLSFCSTLRLSPPWRSAAPDNRPATRTVEEFTAKKPLCRPAAATDLADPTGTRHTVPVFFELHHARLTCGIHAERILKSSQRNRGMPMASADLEQRVTALEAELAKLKAKVDTPRASKALPWWEQIAGSFEGDPLYEEAMRLGRQWRESFRPKSSRRKKQPHARARH